MLAAYENLLKIKFECQNGWLIGISTTDICNPYVVQFRHQIPHLIVVFSLDDFCNYKLKDGIFFMNGLKILNYQNYYIVLLG